MKNALQVRNGRVERKGGVGGAGQIASMQAPTSQELNKREELMLLKTNLQLREFRLREKRKEKAAMLIF